jgi:hypothetical protein
MEAPRGDKERQDDQINFDFEENQTNEIIKKEVNL